jgi:hypothetical protein
MGSNVQGIEWHAKTLRAWQLALLRFAVTLDNADRLAVLMIAREIDRLDPRCQGNPDFGFFRRTSAELCAAIMRPNEHSSAVLRQYLTRIDDARLRRIFAAAVEADPPAVAPVHKPFEARAACGRGFPPGTIIHQRAGPSGIETARDLIRLL